MVLEKELRVQRELHHYPVGNGTELRQWACLEHTGDLKSHFHSDTLLRDPSYSKKAKLLMVPLFLGAIFFQTTIEIKLKLELIRIL